MSKKRKSLGQTLFEAARLDTLYQGRYSDGSIIAPWDKMDKSYRDSFNRIARKFKRAIEKGGK